MEVTVHGLAGGGDGVARLPGEVAGPGGGVVFVPDTAPGDRARVRIAAAGGRRRWQRGELVEVLSPGPGRREPPCPLSLLCGGCQWHHLTEEAQREAKREILARAFRQARLDVAAPAVRPAPAPLGYRRRARLRWERGAGPEASLGFLARRSHRLVPAARCPVLVPALDGLLAVLPGALGTALPEAAAGELHLLASPSGACSAAIAGTGVRPETATRLGEAASGALAGVVALGTEGAALGAWGAPRLDLALPGEPPFLAEPHGFAQANAEVNRALREVVLSFAEAALGPGPRPRPARILELYAGSGNLTRDLAALGPVLAVEASPGAVALGRQSLVGHPVTWRAEDAPAALAALAAEGPAPDLVVLDPPRIGAREALAPLVSLGPPGILYVSCEPMTLARDAAFLVAAGYAPFGLAVLDTMPQTAHFETVLEFRRIRGAGR